MIDFTKCNEIDYMGYNGANGKKLCIEYNDKKYMLKIPLKDEKYSNGAISEYISCKIYSSIGFDTQNVILGTYNIKDKEYIAVACEDFVLNNKNKFLEFKDFASFKNQVITSSENGYGTELDDIIYTINNLRVMDNLIIYEHFWDMFIVDSLLGNFDRHNGNWGFLINRNDGLDVQLAPIFDCGSCLYPALSEEKMKEYLLDPDKVEINKRIYIFPNSIIKYKNKKINYYEFINSLENEGCNNALKRIFPRINLEQINEIIENTPYISDIRKKFYKTMIKERYEKILKPAFLIS